MRGGRERERERETVLKGSSSMQLCKACAHDVSRLMPPVPSSHSKECKVSLGQC